MKLLGVFPSFEPAWKLGGVVRCTSTLFRALADSGMDISVYTTDISGEEEALNVPLEEEVKVGNIKVHYFKSDTGIRKAHTSAGLSKKLKKNISSFDVVYVSAIWQWMGLEVSDIAREAGVPIVIGTHGSFSKNLRKKSAFKKFFYYQLFLKKRLAQASALQITGSIEKKEAGGWLDNFKTFTLANAVEPKGLETIPEDRRDSRRRFNLPQDSLVMMCAGRPDWMKGVEFLIQSLVLKQNWTLLFAGDLSQGSGPAWLSLAKDLGVEDRVISCGFLSQPEYAQALSSSDAFCLPSLGENFSLVVVEAMMVGLPILLTKEVGVWEFVHECPGVFTVKRSDASIAETMSLLEDAKERASWKDGIRDLALREFSPKVVANKFKKELQALLNKTTAK